MPCPPRVEGRSLGTRCSLLTIPYRRGEPALRETVASRRPTRTRSSPSSCISFSNPSELRSHPREAVQRPGWGASQPSEKPPRAFHFSAPPHHTPHAPPTRPEAAPGVQLLCSFLLRRTRTPLGRTRTPTTGHLDRRFWRLALRKRAPGLGRGGLCQPAPARRVSELGLLCCDCASLRRALLSAPRTLAHVHSPGLLLGSPGLTLASATPPQHARVVDVGVLRARGCSLGGALACGPGRPPGRSAAGWCSGGGASGFPSGPARQG